MAIKVDSEKALRSVDLSAEIHSAHASLYGDAGVAGNRLKLIGFDGKFGIIRCSHLKIEESRAALSTVYSVGGVRTAVRVIGVSGTIRGATEKYIPRLSLISADSDGRRIELEEISGRIVHVHGRQIDLCPDDPFRVKGSDTMYLGLTSFDLRGGYVDADGTADGLRQGDNCIQP
jgi:ribonuclease P/MRP protein subunit POP5